jgi:uncharacterized SAM-binding protein YcdF (DUF218 family)
LTLPVFLIAIICATALYVRGHRRAATSTYVVALLTLWGLGTGLPAQWMLQNLQRGQQVDVTHWAARNAIVLLGAGSESTDKGPALSLFNYGRELKALTLYRECKTHAATCYVLSSGGDTHHLGKSEAQLSTEWLLQAGVAPEDLLAETRSLNTFQNAQFTAAILQQHPVDQILLVTSGIQLPRALLYFSFFNVQGEGVRADYDAAMVSVLPNAYNLFATESALHEYVGGSALPPLQSAWLEREADASRCDLRRC